VETMQAGTRLATLMTIRNMNRAIRFYTKTLGAKLRMRGTGAMRDSWAALELAGSVVWLIAPSRREKRALAYSTFLVKNIRSTVRDLARKGVKFQRAERSSPETRVEGPIAFDPFGAAAFFKDPEGNLLMLWQNPPSM
jgi:catechol 2,3-dioxygenase-like lactoylglutathione lyase family enzyme